MLYIVITGHIEDKYHKMVEELQNKLSQATGVCTTADIWTAHNRSFFGTTVHWIDRTSLERNSAALACSRIRGRHTFDIIASTLEQIHAKFRITTKVLCTVTDNGSNFVKAFNVFSEPEAPVAVDPTQTVLSQTDNGEVIFTDVANILDNQSNDETTEYILPPHHRCGAHTMNLIAVADSESANDDASYKKLSRSTFAKCSALWNKSSRSPQAAEVVHDSSQITLAVPNATRWNSFFYSISKLYSIVEKKSEVVLNDICAKLSLPPFRSNEVAFMAEYIKVMHPVAIALDTLQAEDQCFMGVLLPTITSLRVRLTTIRPTLKSAGPLADAILSGLNKRFGAFETKDDLIVASVSHPQFKLRWIQSDVTRVRAKCLLLQAMQIHADSAGNSSECETSTSTEGTGSSFFCFYETDSGVSTVQAELDRFLNDTAHDIASLQHYPLVKEVFVLRNTSLPSSAPVERLFSIGGQILTPRRNSLTDEHFEMLLMLRANKKLY